MASSGQVDENGTVITCPNKCEKTTLVEDSQVQRLPKNWTVIDLVRSGRERCFTAPGRSRQAGDLNLKMGTIHFPPSVIFR